MNIFVRWLLSALIFLIVAYVVPGISIANFWIALIVALVWGVIGATLRPLLLVLTLPINVLTFGFFTFVVNAIFLLLVSALVNGFEVSGFGSALVGAILLAVLQWLADWAFGGAEAQP
jgi:putative membrane protein